jgi:type I restriction enzyme, S subunit
MKNIWKSCTIQDLQNVGEAKLKTGPFGTQLHASDYVEEGTPVINVRNIGFGSIRAENLEFISETTVQRLSSHLLKPYDIVFGRKGAVERHAFIQEQYKGWFQGSDCLRLRIISPSINPRFLSYCFLTQSHQQWMMNQCSHGSTMASLNQDVISRIPLYLPSIDVQSRIVEVLSAYDDLIENNTRRIKILEEMAQLLYREWFVNFRFPGHEEVKLVESPIGLIPEGWEFRLLGEIAKEVRRGVNPENVDPNTPYLGLEHFPRKSIALSEWGKASDVQSTKLVFKKGEILFGKIRPYFHKVGVAPLDGICSSDVIVIQPKDEQYFALVLACVSSEAFVDHATQTSQGTKMPRANWYVLVKYPIPIPPPELLDSFNDFLKTIVNKIHNLTFKNNNLRQTRDLLLPKLISGEIDVEALDLSNLDQRQAIAA